jgi:hypothetical protein
MMMYRNLKEYYPKASNIFFDCLKYLLEEKRLILKPVKIKPRKLSHYKEGILAMPKARFTSMVVVILLIAALLKMAKV